MSDPVSAYDILPEHKYPLELPEMHYDDCSEYVNYQMRSQQAPPPVMNQPITMGVQQHSGVTVVINQPIRTEITVPRPWSSGLCACCEDMGSCCLGYWCPCVLACHVARGLHESCCVPCCAGLLPLRVKLRLQNNIEGSILKDCCVVCCCPTCALCQMAREQTYTTFSNSHVPGEAATDFAMTDPYLA